MILDGVLDTLHVRSSQLKLLLGTALAALIVSVGTVGVLRLVDITINAALPAALGAAAAAYAVKAHRSAGR